MPCANQMLSGYLLIDPMIAAPTYFGWFAVHVCNAPDPGRGVTPATPVTPT